MIDAPVNVPCCAQTVNNFTCTCIDNSVQWNLCKHVPFPCIKGGNKLKDLKAKNGSPINELHICEDRRKRCPS